VRGAREDRSRRGIDAISLDVPTAKSVSPPSVNPAATSQPIPAMWYATVYRAASITGAPAAVESNHASFTHSGTTGRGAVTRHVVGLAHTEANPPLGWWIIEERGPPETSQRPLVRLTPSPNSNRSDDLCRPATLRQM